MLQHFCDGSNLGTESKAAAKVKAHSRVDVAIYCLMLAGAGILSFDQAYLIPSLAAPRYFYTPENEWETLFFQYIPRWLVPIDAKAAKYFHDGLPEGMPIPWGLWVKPLFFLDNIRHISTSNNDWFLRHPAQTMGTKRTTAFSACSVTYGDVGRG